jgi:hypothetical protein
VGFDSIATVAVDGGSNRSRLGMPKFGMFELTPEQLASAKPPTKAVMARNTFRVVPLLRIYLAHAIRRIMRAAFVPNSGASF